MAGLAQAFRSRVGLAQRFRMRAPAAEPTPREEPPSDVTGSVSFEPQMSADTGPRGASALEPSLSEQIASKVNAAGDAINAGAERAASVAADVGDIPFRAAANAFQAIHPPDVTEPGWRMGNTPLGTPTKNQLQADLAKDALTSSAKDVAPLAALSFPPAAYLAGGMMGMGGLERARTAQTPEETGSAIADMGLSAAMMQHGLSDIQPPAPQPEPGQPVLPPGRPDLLQLEQHNAPITDPARLLPPAPPSVIEMHPPPDAAAQHAAQQSLARFAPDSNPATPYVPPGLPGVLRALHAMGEVPPPDARAASMPEPAPESAPHPPAYPPLSSAGRVMRVSPATEPGGPNDIRIGDISFSPHGDYVPRDGAPIAPPQSKPMLPTLPPMSQARQTVAQPQRPSSISDRVLSRVTSYGSWLGPTEEQAQAAGVSLKPGTGGTGWGGRLLEADARRQVYGGQVFDNVAREMVDAGIRPGSPIDYATEAYVENKATPEQRALVEGNPAALKAAQNWMRLRDEAYASPDVDIRGFREHYFPHISDPRSPASFSDFVEQQMKGVGNRQMQADPRTHFLQYRRSDNAPFQARSFIDGVRAYGDMLGYETQVKPHLVELYDWMNKENPGTGKPFVDGVDKKLITDWVNDAILHREQDVDTAIKRQPIVANATAAMNRALTMAGLPAIDNPVSAAASAAKTVASATQVRLLPAAVSHFLGDAMAKLSQKGFVGGAAEYLDGATRMIRGLSDEDQQLLERLNVAKPLPTSEMNNQLLAGLSTAAQRLVHVTQIVDNASKIGSFFTKRAELMARGIPENEADGIAAIHTNASNYYAGQIPASTSRVGGLVSQYLAPSANAVDSLRTWMNQGNYANLARAGMGVTGLYLLGQATGTDPLKRLHILPHRDTVPALAAAQGIADSVSKGELPKIHTFDMDLGIDKTPEYKTIRVPATKEDRKLANRASYGRRMAQKRGGK